jgi:hypothetical protein
MATTKQKSKPTQSSVSVPTKAQTTATRKVEPLSKDAAEILDASINEQIKSCSQALASAYFKLAKSLQEMKKGKGYRQLGKGSWEEYLQSKSEFGRTYLSYMLKIGRVGDTTPLEGFVQQGLTATQLIEYVKATDYPEKLPEVIEATWEEVKGKSVTETRQALKKHIENNIAEFKKPKRSRAVKAKDWKGTFSKQFTKLDKAKQADYLQAMQAFLQSQK